MARVTVCPRCQVELFVPESMSFSTGAECPECGGFIHLNSETLRELPTVFSSTVDFDPVDKPSSATVSDLPSMATLHEGMTDNEAAEDEPAPVTETLDEAAQRIDAWFRSAKTIPDLPTTEPGEVEKETSVNRIAETTSIDSGNSPDATTNAAENNATIDLSASGFAMPDADIDADFELEPTLDESQEPASWEDSQHIERLLAGAQNEPAAEFTPFVAKNSRSESDDDETRATDEWSPEGLPENIKVGGGRRRKRSLVRTLAMTAISGVVGLVLGYYALLWIRGPSGDFLNVAHHLPKAALPASFGSEFLRPSTVRTPVRPAPAAPIAETAETPGAAETVASDLPAEESPPAADNESGEIQASYTEPAEPSGEAAPGEAASTEDKYAPVAPATSEAVKTEEPAQPATEPGGLLTEIAPPTDVAAAAPQIAGAPSFTADQLTASLQAATASQAGLVSGNLSDGKEVARIKGAAYVVLADLAQKLTFVDAVATDVSGTEQEADELFRRTLADAHIRTEVGQITPMWIAAPKRQHGGVFFAGHVSGQKAEGSVVESEVDLGTGKTLTVLLPPALAERLSPASQPVAVVGWIVDRPADAVGGYTGTAPQAVYAGRLIPLE